MGRWRRRAELAARLERVEQRLADVEDSVDLALAPGLVDELAQRIGELSLTVPTQEDLLDLRLATARVATELSRLATHLHASVDRLGEETGDEVAALSAKVESLRRAVVALGNDGPGEPRTILRRA